MHVYAYLHAHTHVYTIVYLESYVYARIRDSLMLISAPTRGFAKTLTHAHT